MRSVFFGSLALSVLCATGSHARIATAKPIRTVQLIRLTAMSPVSPLAAWADETPDVSGVDEAGLPAAPLSGEAAFRLHDMSRRWVEFEMRNSFQALQPNGGTPAVEDAPLARAGVAHVGVRRLATIHRLPAPIAIPAWMRDGLAFSAAAANYVPQCAANAYRPAGFLSAAAESRRSGFYALMSDIACQYGIPTGLFDAMIIRESGYQPTISSPKNAFGLTQLMPGTASGLGVDRYDTEQNLRGGAKYLRQQLDRFGQVHLALAAYNAGPGRVRNGVLPQISETRVYVDNVLLNWRRLSGLTPTIARSASLSVTRAKSAVARSVSVSTY
jgi:hypothetical protein